jgi:hypothetical protein
MFQSSQGSLLFDAMLPVYLFVGRRLQFALNGFIFQKFIIAIIDLNSIDI